MGEPTRRTIDHPYKHGYGVVILQKQLFPDSPIQVIAADREFEPGLRFGRLGLGIAKVA